MDVEQMNNIVDKLADKIGVAADKLLPVANEVVNQYALRNYVQSIGMVGFGGICIVLAVVFYKLCKYTLKKGVEDRRLGGGSDDDAPVLFGVLCVLSFIGVMLCLARGLLCFSNAVSPLASLLGL